MRYFHMFMKSICEHDNQKLIVSGLQFCMPETAVSGNAISKIALSMIMDKNTKHFMSEVKYKKLFIILIVLY